MAGGLTRPCRSRSRGGTNLKSSIWDASFCVWRRDPLGHPAAPSRKPERKRRAGAIAGGGDEGDAREFTYGSRSTTTCDRSSSAFRTRQRNAYQRARDQGLALRRTRLGMDVYERDWCAAILRAEHDFIARPRLARKCVSRSITRSVVTSPVRRAARLFTGGSYMVSPSPSKANGCGGVEVATF